MASIVQGQTTTFKTQLLSGNMDFDVDVFKIALYTNDATLNSETTIYTTTEEVVGTGYTAGGNTLTVVGPASDNTSNSAYVSFDTTTWTGTFSARGALVYNTTSSNYSVCVLDFGEVKTISAQTLTVTFPDNTSTTALIRIE